MYRHQNGKGLLCRNLDRTRTWCPDLSIQDVRPCAKRHTDTSGSKDQDLFFVSSLSIVTMADIVLAVVFNDWFIVRRKPFDNSGFQALI